MDEALNPTSRPRRGIAAALVAATVAAVVGVAVLAAPEPVAASGLARFSSCGEMATWGDAALTRLYGGDGYTKFETVGASIGAEDASVGGAAPTTAAASEVSPGGTVGSRVGDAAVGATNVVVDGVDEPDVVDHLDGDVVLISTSSRLRIVDLGSGEIRATLDVVSDGQVTYDPERQIAWVVGHDGAGHVSVERIRVSDSSLDSDGSWTTPGTLVAARRSGSTFLVVATSEFTANDAGGDASLPFDGGPVRCDQVLHPAGTSMPTATLLVTLEADGAVVPVRTAEVVGSGQLVNVTTDAAYLATPEWPGEGEASTGLHRFDLATLTHTGSGSVEGALSNDFSLSEHDGYLRVAVTHQAVTAVGMPMPMTGVVGSVVEDGAVADEVVDPGATIGPDAPSQTTEASPSSIQNLAGGAAIVAPPPGPMPTGPMPEAEPLNEVVVLDTAGDLDVVGRTPRFGHEGETIQGVRFDGTVGYAVTYLQTDPFYVLDLADPSAPKVVGDVELPGFSAYLHPLPGGLVAGFGPDANGRAAVKLFDVSDPSAPRLVDELVLGDNSPVQSDHHAYVDLGDGRFAVPVSTWGGYGACPPDAMCEGPVEPMPECGPAVDCVAPDSGASSEVVVVDTSGGTLREVTRQGATIADLVTRVIPTSSGWALLGYRQVVLSDEGGSVRSTLDLS